MFLTRLFQTLITASLALSATGTVLAMQENAKMTDTTHAVFLPKDIQWSDDIPPSLPKGAKIAVLEGDPAKKGLFTMRIKFPPNYRIAPHWHPEVERVTIISGKAYIGMGDQFDTKKAITLPAGSFLAMQPKTHHYAFSHGETILQLNGVGPWKITYINPQDDPQNKKEEG